MRYAHILSRVTSAPWLITEAGGNAVSALINSRLIAEPAPARPDPAGQIASIVEKTAGGTDGRALIPVCGVLGKNLGMLETLCGGVDVDSVLSLVEDALTSADVEAVVMHIDSPGGAANGLPEAHAELRKMRAKYGKPLLAFVDGMCCSGGIYLAAACDSITCTRSAQLGSIGAITQLRFKMMQNAAEGIEVRTYKYGKFKDLGNPNRLPTPEEDALIQARINTLGQMFEADMRAARPQMKPEVFESLVYFGEQALAIGLADEMVGSIGEYLSALRPARV